MCQALYYLVHRARSKLRNSNPPQSQVFNKWMKITWVHTLVMVLRKHLVFIHCVCYPSLMR